MKNQRLRSKVFVPSGHPDFDFVKPGYENLFMVGFGYHTGKVFTELKDYEHYSRAEKTHYFIRCADIDTVERFKNMEESFLAKLNFSATARLLTTNKRKIIETYIENYPERTLGTLYD